MPTPTVAPQNLLMAALPAAARRRLLARRSPVELVLSDVLAEPGEPIRYVFFPVEGFVSLIVSIDGGAQLEVGLVGNEGMVGTSLLLGVGVAPLRALVQGGGSAWRVEAAAFSREIALTSSVQARLARYVQVQLIQLAQNAACVRFHVIEARLARWLLMTRDRAHSSTFGVTHEFLAFMLGVRRAGVTRAASALQARDLIRYVRGELEIRDARGLELAACDCYAADKRTYARNLR
ncbi:MAG TPA: Crp/Fnr family transcriptional regulator [Gammaproteobacteria bacterium]|nr:Crp/Fnr family transcriptional regulator [Gammaproteobacteria bacterium]